MCLNVYMVTQCVNYNLLLQIKTQIASCNLTECYDFCNRPWQINVKDEIVLNDNK
jgi:hypothetical protein